MPSIGGLQVLNNCRPNFNLFPKLRCCGRFADDVLSLVHGFPSSQLGLLLDARIQPLTVSTPVCRLIDLTLMLLNINLSGWGWYPSTAPEIWFRFSVWTVPALLSLVECPEFGCCSRRMSGIWVLFLIAHLPLPSTNLISQDLPFYCPMVPILVIEIMAFIPVVRSHSTSLKQMNLPLLCTNE